MTWDPRIIQGGATPRPAAPIQWWHDECDLGETVLVAWTEPGAGPGSSIPRLARLLETPGETPSGFTFVAGNRPDDLTLRELAEDIARWRAAEAADPRHTLESPRWGARYRR